MNSKDRVLQAINHREPDRVPVDFWWSHEIMEKLLSHLKLRNADELQKFFRSDIRCVYPSYAGPKLRKFENGSYEDFWGAIRKPYAHGGGEYDELVFAPLANAESVRDVDNIRWPDPDWFDYESLRKHCEQYNGYAIMVGRMGLETQTIFIQTWFLRGLDKILLDLVMKPDLVKAMVDRIMQFRIEHVKRILDVVKGHAHILQIADDYGMQKGLMMSPEMWREFFAPHLKTLADMIHEAGLKVFLHCCGSSRKIIPDLIELGVDILNPIQPNAAGMNPRELKEHYGDKLCFHGGVDTQITLPYGNRDEVFSEVKERIKVLGKGGGYILAPVHTVEPDVPIENVLAVYEAVRQYGQY